jgi:hypothetical protein
VGIVVGGQRHHRRRSEQDVEEEVMSSLNLELEEVPARFSRMGEPIDGT